MCWGCERQKLETCPTYVYRWRERLYCDFSYKSGIGCVGVRGADSMRVFAIISVISTATTVQSRPKTKLDRYIPKHD